MLKEKDVAEKAVSHLQTAIRATKADFYEKTLDRLEACLHSAAQLIKIISEKFESDPDVDTKEYPPPNFSKSGKALEECKIIVAGALKEKLPSPKPEDTLVETIAGGETGEQKVSHGQLRSREDAIRQLKNIAAFFQVTEPLSPIAYLVLRAARWGDLSLDDWLDEVVKEPAVLEK